jgi:hypothetical protein
MRAFDFPSGAQTRGREKQEQDALTSAAIRGDILDLASALLLPDVRLRLHKRCAWYDPAGIVRGHCPPNLQGPFRRTSFPSATPLLLACIGGHTQCVQMLLNANASVVSCRDTDHNTPLHIAAMFKHTAIAKLLLLHGAQVDAMGHDLVTPLYYAAFHVETDMAVLLLDHGADVDDFNFREHEVYKTFYETALYTAWVRENEQMIRVLLDYGADTENFGPIPHAGGQISFTALSLKNVNDAGVGHPKFQMYTRIREMFLAEPARREALRLAKCEAFAMGHHPRLGAESRIVNLDDGVVRMIVERI